MRNVDNWRVVQLCCQIQATATSGVAASVIRFDPIFPKLEFKNGGRVRDYYYYLSLPLMRVCLFFFFLRKGREVVVVLCDDLTIFP